MTLSEAILLPCGLRYMVDALDIRSGVARHALLNQEMCTDPTQLQAVYNQLSKWTTLLHNSNAIPHVRTIQFRLQALKDLHTTLTNLTSHRVLDDIELFEVKHLALLSLDIKRELDALHVDFLSMQMEEVVQILDPDGMQVGTFYVYESYSPLLPVLHRQLEQNPHNEQAFLALEEEELRIRTQLSEQLRHYANNLNTILSCLIDLDICLAKAGQIVHSHLCLPQLTNNVSRLNEMWNPEVKAAVEHRGNTYRTVNIQFGNSPVVITGSNMGGKTVVLKTVALCQLLAQFGFGIPAQSAEIVLRQSLYYCMTDGQSVESGLSSFAAEMKQIDAVIKAARRGENLLALIDEPARTTNPTEGTALVSGLIKTLQTMPIGVLLVTHYTISASAHACSCLRVRGMNNGMMDYTLIQAKEGEVPHEALTIARQLGVDGEWLNNTKEYENRQY